MAHAYPLGFFLCFFIRWVISIIIFLKDVCYRYFSKNCWRTFLKLSMWLQVGIKMYIKIMIFKCRPYLPVLFSLMIFYYRFYIGVLVMFASILVTNVKPGQIFVIYWAKQVKNQLLQLCTARTAWSESDQAVRTVHSCNSLWLALLWSDSVIKLVSVLFGECTTLVVTKCWPMVNRKPCGDQWKAEKLGTFWRRPITRCLIKSDSS